MRKFIGYTDGWSDENILENAQLPKSQRVEAAPRSVAANNPGALNFARWQTQAPGFLGKTKDDGKGNVTAVYRTPEDGAYAFFHLIVNIYSMGEVFTLRDLAKRYSGGSQSLINQYKKAWPINSELGFDELLSKNNVGNLVRIAQAMFTHESGFWSHVPQPTITRAALRSLGRSEIVPTPKPPSTLAKSKRIPGALIAGGAPVIAAVAQKVDPNILSPIVFNGLIVCAALAVSWVIVTKVMDNKGASV